MGASISGSIRDTVIGVPLLAGIEIYDSSQDRVCIGSRDEHGDFAKASGFGQCAVYLDRTCPPPTAPLDATNATPIVLAPGEVHDGIDFRIDINHVFRDGFELPATR